MTTALSSFSAEFLTARHGHLVKKLENTQLALGRVGMPQMYRAYKEYELIPEIERALDRIAQGTYGICVDCDEEIAEERLINHPQVSRCVSCQTKHERATA